MFRVFSSYFIPKYKGRNSKLYLHSIFKSTYILACLQKLCLFNSNEKIMNYHLCLCVQYIALITVMNIRFDLFDVCVCCVCVCGVWCVCVWCVCVCVCVCVFINIHTHKHMISTNRINLMSNRTNISIIMK